MLLSTIDCPVLFNSTSSQAYQKATFYSEAEEPPIRATSSLQLHH